MKKQLSKRVTLAANHKGEDQDVVVYQVLVDGVVVYERTDDLTIEGPTTNRYWEDVERDVRLFAAQAMLASRNCAKCVR